MKTNNSLSDWLSQMDDDFNLFIQELAFFNVRRRNPFRTENISPDRQLSARLSKYNEITIRDILNDQEMSILSVSGNIDTFSFSADSSKLFVIFHTSSSSETVKVWDRESDTFTYFSEYQTKGQGVNGGWVGCYQAPFAVSPDGRLLALGGEGCKIRIISAEKNNNELCTLSNTIGSSGVMKFSPNSELLATAFTGGEIQIWNTENCDLVHTIYDHPDTTSRNPTINFSFSPTGNLLGVAYGIEGATITLWGVEP